MNKNEKGFSLVELLVVVIIIAIVAAIAIPNLLASRRAANEASAISSLRTIHSAEATYQATIGQGTAYGDLTDLGTQGLVDNVLGGSATPSKSGYDFDQVGTLTDVYCVTAVPTNPGSSGIREFGVGIDGVIYAGAGAGTIGCTAADGVITGGSVIQ